MSIIMVTGKPGSGKSLSLVKVWILRNIRKIGSSGERLIYTNVAGLNSLHLSLAADKKYSSGDIAFPLDEIEKMFVAVPPASQIRKANEVIMSMSPHSLLIIDEAQKYWNNRDFKSETNKQILEYFTEHRRRGHDVILATQNYEQVDIGIRRLCEAHYNLERMKKIGLASSIRVRVYDQALDVDNHVGRETWRIDSSIYKCYSSYEGGAEHEIVYKGPNLFLDNYKLIFLFVVIVSMLVKFFFFGKKENTPESYFGSFVDYFCEADNLYVLRNGNKVDTIPVLKVPKSVCPRAGFQYSLTRTKEVK